MERGQIPGFHRNGHFDTRAVTLGHIFLAHHDYITFLMVVTLDDIVNGFLSVNPGCNEKGISITESGFAPQAQLTIVIV